LKTRTPWQVTRSVWYALFMREAIARTMADRMAWFWMLAEPVAMIAIMVMIRTVVLGRDSHIAGADFIPWLIVGLFGFHLFRENMMRSIGAVEANQALFGYRQVKPVDPVLVRCYLEGMLKTFIFLLFILAGILLELDLIPDFRPVLVGRRPATGRTAAARVASGAHRRRDDRSAGRNSAVHGGRRGAPVCDPGCGPVPAGKQGASLPDDRCTGGGRAGGSPAPALAGSGYGRSFFQSIYAVVVV
jgi:hypothetical protein